MMDLLAHAACTALRDLLWLVVQVIVQGIKTVERAVINQNKDKTYGLLVEGTDLQVRGSAWGCVGGGGLDWVS